MYVEVISIDEKRQRIIDAVEVDHVVCTPGLKSTIRSKLDEICEYLNNYHDYDPEEDPEGDAGFSHADFHHDESDMGYIYNRAKVTRAKAQVEAIAAYNKHLAKQP